jgi:hypothetical protein
VTFNDAPCPPLTSHGASIMCALGHTHRLGELDEAKKVLSAARRLSVRPIGTRPFEEMAVRTALIFHERNQSWRRLRFPYGSTHFMAVRGRRPRLWRPETGGAPALGRSYCNLIEAPCLVNGGHSASLRHPPPPPAHPPPPSAGARDAAAHHRHRRTHLVRAGVRTKDDGARVDSAFSIGRPWVGQRVAAAAAAYLFLLDRA